MAEKKVACDCGVTIRAASDSELIARVQQHAREVHRMDMTAEQVLAMATPV